MQVLDALAAQGPSRWLDYVRRSLVRGGDLDVPENDYSFGRLIAAQALGDHHALLARERRVLRVQLGSNVTIGLAALEVALEV